MGGRRRIPTRARCSATLLAAAAALTLAATAARAADPPPPYYFWVWFADGGAHPGIGSPGGSYGPAAPAPFTCKGIEPVDVCKRDLVRALRKIYADFNIIVTTEKPPTGRYFLQVVMDTNGWGGVGPLSCGGAVVKGVSWVFGFDNMAELVCISSQEMAHTVGLMHTDAPGDVMASCSPGTIGTGFANVDANAIGGCRTTQNSHQLMLDRLGAWPGGPHPLDEGAVGPVPVPDGGNAGAPSDAGADAGAGDHPAGDGGSGADGGQGQGDAGQGDGGTHDGATGDGGDGGDDGGCGCRLGAGHRGAAPALPLALVALAVMLRPWRTSRTSSRTCSSPRRSWRPPRSSA